MAKSTKIDPDVIRAFLPTDMIVPDPANRRIVEDEDLEALCDSIRLLGVLQPPHVVRQADGTHRLIDGERRWRAARRLGLVEIPCDVWPEDTDPRRVTVAGLVLNEHRRAHGCLHVARRLRHIKNENGFNLAEVAGHTGFPLDRVKTYASLFAASDDMMKFLEDKEVPLKVAAELVRFEKATNEARARKLCTRHVQSPLTVQEIVALRKREEGARGKRTAVEAEDAQPTARAETITRLLARVEGDVRRDPAALRYLDELARRLGYRLVAVDDDAIVGS